MKPVIAVTVGDPGGIGPEVALKAVQHQSVCAICHPVLVGPWKVFQYYAQSLKRKQTILRVHETGGERSISIAAGRPSASSGRLAAEAVENAVRLVRRGAARAVVTSPVSKQALHKAGIPFAGQTEFLQHLTGAKHVAMMLVSDSMRVGLVTIHIPIGDVARTITRKLIRDKIDVIHKGLVSDWAIESPRLAVLGLNPHAGEGGDIGMEEERLIKPVIREMQVRGLMIDGPFPADSFFGRNRYRDYDAVVAMYHDQGLIPLKMSSSGKAVNVTLGLPLIRTSPDHGTAFDIAGKGIADPSSMVEAIFLAATLSRRRELRGGLLG